MELGEQLLLSALTGTAGYFIAWLRRVPDKRLEWDTTLLQKRIDAYVPLWAATAPLAIYGPARDLDVVEIERFAKDLRRCYFVSGMLWTVPVRETYFLLQAELRKLLAAPPPRPIRLRTDQIVQVRTAVGDPRLIDYVAPAFARVTAASTDKPDPDLEAYSTLYGLSSALRTRMTEDTLGREEVMIVERTFEHDRA